MPYPTDAMRRALAADRERVGLAARRTAPTLGRTRIGWPWVGVLRMIRSLTILTLGRPTSLRRPRSLTEEGA